MFKNLTISSGTIKKKLKSTTPKKSLIEYIENGIDAGAKNININFKINKGLGVEFVENISIEDDGNGINFNNLEETFGIYGDSKKSKLKYTSNTSGKDGQGRLTFFVFASSIEWKTIYLDNGENKEYSIKMSAGNLQKIDIPEKKEFINVTKERTGTKVIFNNLLPNIDQHYLNNDFINELYKRLSWRIILQKIKIYINGSEILLNQIIEDDVTEEVEIENHKFKVRFIKWKKSMIDEESRYYFLDSSNIENFKIATTYNRGGDEFYHSLYIKSKYFDNFSFSKKSNDDQIGMFDDGTINQHDKNFIKLKKELHKLVGKKRKPFIEKYANEFLNEKFKKGGIIKKGESLMEEWSYNTVRDTFKEIYLIEPKFLSVLNDRQLGIFAKLINVVLVEGEATKIFDIIDSTLGLEKDERDKFAKILKNIELSNIIRTIDLINDRFKVLKILEEFVFNKELKANEVKHLQTLISKHYWIFGEEYNLVGEAEVKFEENLRKFLYLLRGDKKKKGTVKINDPDKLKEMDIFMCKVDRQSDSDNSKVKNIVVELKHPNIKLGHKEYSQVMTYMSTIFKEDRFNGKGYEWKFYLIGNRYDEIIKSQLNSGRVYGKDVIHFDSEKNYKIFCKTWSDILEENKTKLNFIKKQLNLKEKEITLENADEGLDKINNSAELEGEINI